MLLTVRVCAEQSASAPPCQASGSRTATAHTAVEHMVRRSSLGRASHRNSSLLKPTRSSPLGTSRALVQDEATALAAAHPSSSNPRAGPARLTSQERCSLGVLTASPALTSSTSLMFHGCRWATTCRRRSVSPRSRPRHRGCQSGLSRARQPAMPNPSFNRRANGTPPGPGRWYSVHSHRPGPGGAPLPPG
jgi:hypothetical protein